MQVSYGRCAGLDIGKKFLVVTFLGAGDGKDAVKETATFDAHTGALLKLRACLQARRCEAAAMESTGP